MRNLILKSAFALVLSAAPIIGSAQEKVAAPKKEKIPSMRIKFNEKGDKYMQTNMFGQIWFRTIENNPGTLVNGNPENYTLDAGVRRLRMAHTLRLSPNFMFYVHYGVNGKNFKSTAGTDFLLNLHDAYGKYTVIPDKDAVTGEKNLFTLNIGTGLHSWNGVSRFTNASSSKLLSADLPTFNFPTIGKSDRIARQFGVFAHGSVEKLAYRVSVSKPFATNEKPTSAEIAVDNNKGNLSFDGYFFYQFFDTEGQNLPFLAGTHLGERRILNVGAGFYNNKNGVATLDGGKLKHHDINVFGVDVAADMPFGNPDLDMSFTLYSVYYNYNFGPNYKRTVGTMNTGDKEMDPEFKGDRAMEGFGNARYSMGTGSVIYTQAGVVLPKFSESIRIQPFVTHAYKNLEALNQPGHYIDAGANLLLEGQNAKITLQYSNRPLYKADTKKVFKRAGEFLVSLQYAL